MRILSTGSALPEHRYDQATLLAALERIWCDHPGVLSRLPGLLERVRVRARHLALPLEAYAELGTFGAANDAWIRVGTQLGERAIGAALERAGLAARDVDAIFAVTVTGVASPSLDARLANRLGLRPDLKRTPIFGLGCVAGVAGLARAADYVRAFPDQVALVLSVELCSLTFQREDLSVAHLVSAGLFGDGAAAVVVVGEERARRLGRDAPRVLATRAVQYPDTEEVMGWRVDERGFNIVLSAEVPRIALEHLPGDVDAFLADQGLTRGDVATWVCHPGGPRVLEALRDGLGLSDRDLRHAWGALERQGNLSSASVLMVLEATLADGPPGPEAMGLCLGLGPGFCSELVLFRWGGG